MSSDISCIINTATWQIKHQENTHLSSQNLGWEWQARNSSWCEPGGGETERIQAVVGLVVDMVQASGTVMQPTTQHTFLENGMDPTVVLISNALQGNTLDHMMSTVGASCHKQNSCQICNRYSWFQCM